MAIDKITTPAVTDDSVTLAKMAPGTDGNIISYDASGNPVAVATGSAGQVLTSAGAGAPPTFAAAGGITEADSFRLSATQAISSGTDTVLSGFSRDNESTFGKIGTGLSESSGVFTFATTGIYLIIANFYLQINGDLTYGSPKIQGTTNNSSYVNMSYNDQSIKQVVGNTYCAVTNHNIMDCQDTSNYKFRLSIYGTQALNVLGSANDSHTFVTTIRLGNT